MRSKQFDRTRRMIAALVVTWITIAFICVMVPGCTANMSMKPWSEQTSKDRLVWMLGIYNAQDRDYRSMAALPSLTPAQVKVLKTKKEIMTQVYPLIDAYRVTVEAGGTPSAQTEQMILDLLNRLTTVGG